MDWTGLAANSISTFLGGCLALLGVHLTNRRSESARRTETLRARGEELYALNTDFLRGLNSYILRRLSVVYGNLTYNQMLDQEIDALKGKTFDLGRMEMLVEVYFPTARHAFESLIQARDTMNEIALEHKRAYASGNPNSEQFEIRFQQAMSEIDAAGELLGKSLVDGLRSL